MASPINPEERPYANSVTKWYARSIMSMLARVVSNAGAPTSLLFPFEEPAPNQNDGLVGPDSQGNLDRLRALASLRESKRRRRRRKERVASGHG
jgi:hypothetical protein